MANMKWLGNAPAIAQIDTFTPGGTIEDGDVFILTVTGENGDTVAISFNVGTTPTAISAGLIAAWNASTNLLCTGITASGTATVVLTADVAGVPFNVVGTTTEAGGGAADNQTFTRVATLANSGPYDWNTQSNWSGGANLPGADAGDVVYIEGGYVKYGLNQSAISNILAALYATKCQIGENGSNGVLPSYLRIKSTKIEINYNYIGTPNYLSPINIDAGTTATTIVVYNSGINSISTEAGVNLKVIEATSDIYIYAGKVGIAYHAGEVSTADNIFVLSNAAYVYIGATVTLTGGMIEQRNGYVYCFTTITIPEVNVYNGNFYQLGAVTITALNAVGGITDLTLSSAAKIVTTPKLGIGAALKFNPANDTMTNMIQPYETSGNIQFTSVAV